MNHRISAHGHTLEMANLPPAKEASPPFSPRKFFVGLGCGLAVTTLAASFWADAVVQRFVQENTDPMSLRAAAWIGRWGDFGGVAAVALAVWWTAGRFGWARVRYWIQVMLLASVLSGLSANAVRVLSGRTRPNSGLAEGWHGPRAAADFANTPYRFHAFPSAHTAVVAGFLSPVFVQVARRQRRRVTHWGLAAGALCGIALMGGARIWVGAHHFSDVTAAVLLGCAWGGCLACARPLVLLRRRMRNWRVGLLLKLFTR